MPDARYLRVPAVAKTLILACVPAVLAGCAGSSSNQRPAPQPIRQVEIIREDVSFPLKKGISTVEIDNQYGEINVRDHDEDEVGVHGVAQTLPPDFARARLVSSVDGESLRLTVQLPEGKYYVVKHAHLAWGTADTIRLIQGAIASYRQVWRSSPKIHVGDISKKGGGKFPPHNSHQHGRDVDIGYVLKGDKSDEVKFVNATSSNLDVERSWDLISAFLDTDEIKYIFMDYSIQKLLYDEAKRQGVSRDTLDELFQYPRGKGRGHGIIRHSTSSTPCTATPSQPRMTWP